jgi:hypothetical protein
MGLHPVGVFVVIQVPETQRPLGANLDTPAAADTFFFVYFLDKWGIHSEPP